MPTVSMSTMSTNNSTFDDQYTSRGLDTSHAEQISNGQQSLDGQHPLDDEQISDNGQVSGDDKIYGEQAPDDQKASHGQRHPRGQQTTTIVSSKRKHYGDENSFPSRRPKFAPKNAKFAGTRRSTRRGKGMSKEQKQKQRLSASSMTSSIRFTQPDDDASNVPGPKKSELKDQSGNALCHSANEEAPERNTLLQPVTESMEAHAATQPFMEPVEALAVAVAQSATKPVEVNPLAPAVRTCQVEEKTIFVAHHTRKEVVNLSSRIIPKSPPITNRTSRMKTPTNPDIRPAIQVTINSHRGEKYHSTTENKAMENDETASNLSHTGNSISNTGSNLPNAPAHVQTAQSFISRCCWLIIASLRALLFNTFSVLWAPILLILVAVAVFFLAIRLACSVSLINPWLTLCHPVPQNPICGIPYAHNIAVYCDPPSGPRPIYNGSASIDIPNKYIKIFDAAAQGADLPISLRYQLREVGPFHTLIRGSNLDCKDELADMVGNLTAKLRLACNSLAELTRESTLASNDVYYSLMRLSNALKRHSRAPFKVFFMDPIMYYFSGVWPTQEPDFSSYKEDWSNFFEAIIGRFEVLITKATKVSALLEDMEKLLSPIRGMVADEQIKTENTKMLRQSWRTLFLPSHWDITDVVRDVKSLEGLESCLSTSGIVVINLIVNLGQLQTDASWLVIALKNPKGYKDNSLSLRLQIDLVLEALENLESSRNAALGRRKRAAEELVASALTNEERLKQKQRDES